MIRSLLFADGGSISQYHSLQDTIAWLFFPSEAKAMFENFKKSHYGSDAEFRAATGVLAATQDVETTLPFALLQILSLRNIALGGRPIWLLLRVTAISVFSLTAYFLTLTFWLR